MYISSFHMNVRYKKFDNDIMYICVQYYYLCYKLHSVFLHSSDYVKLFLQLKRKIKIGTFIEICLNQIGL